VGREGYEDVTATQESRVGNAPGIIMAMSVENAVDVSVGSVASLRQSIVWVRQRFVCCKGHCARTGIVNGRQKT